MFVDRAIFIKGKAGNSIPVTVSSSPLFDDFGNIIGGIETFRDNTSSIRESLILDSIADGVFTVDRHWKITSFNRAAEEITGWSRDEAMGKSCSDVFHSSICGRNCAIAESLYKGTPAANRSITIVNSRGDKVPISISAAPLTDHEGNIIGGVETFRDLSVITELRQQLSQRFTFDNIISKAPAMQRLFTILPDIARSPSTVLILGERHRQGTHRPVPVQRQRAGGRAVRGGQLRCPARDPARIGAVRVQGGRLHRRPQGPDRPVRRGRGRHPVPRRDRRPARPGAGQAAARPPGQGLRAAGLEHPGQGGRAHHHRHQPQPGGTGAGGRLRDDLFYRLNVVKISLPPLRERKEDIPLLIEHFIKKYSAQQGKDIVGMASEALAILMRHDFPGNIRELENIVEYAFILCEGGYIQPEHLPEPFAAGVGAEETVQLLDTAEPRSWRRDRKTGHQPQPGAQLLAQDGHLPRTGHLQGHPAPQDRTLRPGQPLADESEDD